MKTFTLTITVNEEHLDDLLHVNNVQYVQWVQEIAKQHWLNNASKSINDNYFWVLSSHFIEYKNAAFLNDALLLKTYIEKYEGAVCYRIVEIINQVTKALLVKSETKWCLIDAKTKRPTRITQEISRLFE